MILLRGGAQTLEVLLVKRNPAQRFMGGAWVFPGGAVDAAEGEGDAAHRLAGVREMAEEAGVTLPDPAALVKFSRWITPARGADPLRHPLLPRPRARRRRAARVDGDETVDVGWFTPAGALEAHAREEILLVFPTIKHLEQLGRSHRRRAARLRPRAARSSPCSRAWCSRARRPGVLLPGEPGYEG